MSSGIYVIRNTENNKVYVGSAKNFKKRWKRHIRDLNNDKHCNIILQRSFNKNGKNLKLYEFEIVEECEYVKDMILTKEDFYIKEYKSKNRKHGYNITDASFGDNLTNHPHRKEIIKKISETLKKTVSKLTTKERSEKWGQFGKLNGRWDSNIKDKKCPICESIFRLKKVCCSGKCWYIYLNKNSDTIRGGKNNPFYNKKHSTETINILSKIGKKRGYKGTQNIPFKIGDDEFMSLGEASKKLHIHITTICYRLKSKNKKFKNYKYL